MGLQVCLSPHPPPPHTHTHTHEFFHVLSSMSTLTHTRGQMPVRVRVGGEEQGGGGGAAAACADLKCNEGMT